MKTLARVLLSFIFIVSFVCLLFTSVVKFQLLNYDFWVNSFSKHSVYNNLAFTAKKSIDTQVGKEGGNVNDIEIITDLITEENTKDLMNRNLKNFLDYFNGRASEINVYIPIAKVPKGLLPKRFEGLKETMPLYDLAAKFNLQNFNDLPINSFSQFGKTMEKVWIFALTLSVLFLVFIFMLIEKGTKMVSLGLNILFGGLISIFTSVGLKSVQLWFIGNYTVETNIQHAIFAVVVPSILTEMTRNLNILGVGLIISGIILIFVRKYGDKKV